LTRRMLIGFAIFSMMALVSSLLFELTRPIKND